MSTSHDRAQKRYRARQKNDTVADAMGWEATDIVSVYLRPDGVHVAMDTNSRRVPLVSEQFVKVDAPALTPVGSKRIYAPKSWNAANWNRIVGVMREATYIKENAITQITEGTTLDDKQKAQAIAVINALPDTPDWYDLLPLAEEA